MFTHSGNWNAPYTRRIRASVLLTLAAVLHSAGAATAQPTYGWLPGFGYAGVADRTGNERVLASVSWDDGSGPANYVGGRFTAAGEVAATSLARWDGRSWSAVGGGVGSAQTDPPTVHALRVWDDGTGEALYVGGNFTTAGGRPAPALARWDGRTWTPLIDTITKPDGSSSGAILALEVFDDGDGPALYAAGTFASINGLPVRRIARWKKGQWSDVGSTATAPSGGWINALAVYDDGNGPQLFAGGSFHMHQIPASHVARWNGKTWSNVGAGVSSLNNPFVSALQVFDDDAGPKLYAGGRFSLAGGLAANHIARWDGQSWQSLNGGVTGSDPNTQVHALHVWDDGAGDALYVGGRFSQAGVASCTGLARWKPGWEAVATGQARDVTHLQSCIVEGDNRLVVGAVFASLPGGRPHGLALWEGASWQLLGSNGGPDGAVKTLLSSTDAGQARLMIAGEFRSVADAPFRRVAQWNGGIWSGLGQGIGGPGLEDGAVVHLVAHDFGGAPNVVALGSFATAGPALAPGAARWDGGRWRGLPAAPGTQLVRGAVFDDGTGPALFAVGEFPAGGSTVRGLARWSGSNWEMIGALSGWGLALEVFDDGSGPALYVGGAFSHAAGIPARSLARWDGQAWTTLGDVCSSATNCGPNPGIVYDMAVYDDGNGPGLYIAGNFVQVDGQPARAIARYDATGWRSVGDPMLLTGFRLCLFDEGNGPSLIVGGRFTSNNTAGMRGVGRWDGRAWSSLGIGLNDPAWALGVHDEDGGGPLPPTLFVGGGFSTSGEFAAMRLARWGPLTP